jgi:hypothetical protein
MENLSSDPKADGSLEEFDLRALATVNMQERKLEEERCVKSFAGLLTSDDTFYARALGISIA